MTLSVRVTVSTSQYASLYNASVCTHTQCACIRLTSLAATGEVFGDDMLGVYNRPQPLPPVLQELAKVLPAGSIKLVTWLDLLGEFNQQSGQLLLPMSTQASTTIDQLTT